jgi:hypothetical protein
MKAGNYCCMAVILLLPVLWLQTTGCAKEYSFEGTDTSALRRDTIPPPPGDFKFPVCNLCDAAAPMQVGTWSFKIGNAYLCGNTTDAIITADKNAFTFFGPSACSTDSGMVITIYMEPDKLTGDKHNVTINKVVFFYYDHNATAYVLMSQTGVGFTLTIDDYTESTGIATGTFSGGTFRANGAFVYVKEGRYKIKLRR